MNMYWLSNLCVNSASLNRSEMPYDDVPAANTPGALHSACSTVYPPADPPVIAMRFPSTSARESCVAATPQSTTSTTPH